MAVEQKFLEVSLKDDFKEVFKSSSDSSFNETIETSLAIIAFVENRVTLARAAELAGKGLAEFIDILSRRDIAWMEYTEETQEGDRKTLEKLRGIKNG